MNFVLTVFCFFLSVICIAGNQLGIIKDPDGYTNVRSGPGIDFIVIDTLFAEEFFYYDPGTKSDWIKVMTWKIKQVEGFVHRSRIQAVKQLPHKGQKKMITAILTKQKESKDRLRNGRENWDSLTYASKYREAEQFVDTKYNPALDMTPQYFCATRDTQILQLLFATIWTDRNSANEMPSFSIGDCTVCLPEIVFGEIRKLKDDEQKNRLYDDIEWGLLNHFYVEDNGKSDNPEYNKLKKKLEYERNNADYKLFI